jgi:4-carboxymuconolactone decarboxylase
MINIWENNKRTVKANMLSLLVMFSFLVPALALVSEANNMEQHQALDRRQRSIIPIAAFTSNGDLQNLKAALNEGLDAGLTLNEVKEILIQMYAYAGFPRSLNGIQTFMTVMEERKAKGIKDEVGREPSPLPPDTDKDAYGAKVRAELAGQKKIPPPSGYQLFAPGIDTFLKEHLFADIFARDVLDHRSRELATIAALAGMTGTEGQLRFHLGASMNVGLTEGQLKDFISVLESRVSREKAEKAGEVLSAVLADRK